MSEKPELKFYLKSERLDWEGKIKTKIDEIKIPWTTYDPKRILEKTIISGDISTIPAPFTGVDSAVDFMQKFTGDKDFEWNDFNRYISVESEVVNGSKMKFVVIDHNNDKMRWVEA